MIVSAAPHAPTLTFITRLSVDVGRPVELGESAWGWRRFIPVTGGSLAGPYLAGRILPGGGDWQTVRGDGVIDLAAHYPLQLTDGTCVEFDNQGLRHDIGRASSHYFQTTARLIAPGGTYQWLTRTVFVAAAERQAESVQLAVFALGDFSTTRGDENAAHEPSGGATRTP